MVKICYLCPADFEAFLGDPEKVVNIRDVCLIWCSNNYSINSKKSKCIYFFSYYVINCYQ